MTRIVALVMAVMATGLILLGPSPVAAFNCPVVIKQAEELIRKAEGKASPETRPLVEEAKKYLEEARAHHGGAKTKRDHGDAVRKAKFAIALAEEVIILQSQ